jgi:hypothetical protein
MSGRPLPKVTFGIIVLNGEPFTRYCLRSLYPFAHEIIVVEGGHEACRAVTTPDGHSVDGTLDALRRFKQQEDPEDKVTIVTRDGFWPQRDELGRDRTPQSRQYAQRATGDYLWQVDIDEFYRHEDMRRTLEMLSAQPSVTAVSFLQATFWARPRYRCGGWYEWQGGSTYHRLFKWGPGYEYVTHEPPTVRDARGRDLRDLHWVSAQQMASRGVLLHHYSLLFPWQVEQKTRLYRDEKPDMYGEVLDWAEHSYTRLGHPYHVHNLYELPSWLERWTGSVPHEVLHMMGDVESGRVEADLRPVDDVEALLSTRWYGRGRAVLRAAAPWAARARAARRWAGLNAPVPRWLRRSYWSAVREAREAGRGAARRDA